jgi:hypothetical protein
MKKSIAVIALGLFSLSASAAQHTFTIHDPKYGEDCTYSVGEGNHAVSEDGAVKGTGMCWDIRMIRKADEYIVRNNLKYKNPNIEKGVNLIKATFRACAVGSSTSLTPQEKTKIYNTLILEFKGDEKAIDRVADAFRKGRLLSGVADYKYCQNVALGQ